MDGLRIRISRDLLSALVATALAVGSISVWAEQSGVPPARDFSADGRHAKDHNVAILLEFSAEYCGYCMLLEEDFLEPMLVSGDYDDKVIIRGVPIDQELPLIDFNGEATTTAALANRFDVDLTPTMVLVDAGGQVLTKPIVGIWTPDFFGGIIDEHIELALARLRDRRPERVTGQDK